MSFNGDTSYFNGSMAENAFDVVFELEVGIWVVVEVWEVRVVEPSSWQEHVLGQSWTPFLPSSMFMNLLFSLNKEYEYDEEIIKSMK